jgi:tetratricopeptide (TPR) repeat protein
MRVGDIRGNDERGTNVGDLKAARASYEKALAALDQLSTSRRADREIFIERVVAQRQIAEIDARAVGARAALASITGAVAAAQELLTRYPADPAVRDLVGDVLVFAGLRQREAGDLTSSLGTTTQALEIIRRRAAEAPANPDLANALASAESAVGMAEARLGNLAQAAAHYERAVDVGERLVQLDPQSVNKRRSLMLAYSHIGDVQGLPSLPNLGDLAGAERAYRRMAELAEHLNEADAQDARSSVDYALSLMRLASVIPANRAAEKEEQLRRSAALLTGLLERMPDNLTVRTNAGFVELDIANLLRDLGREPQAAAHYRTAIAVTRPLLDSGNVSPIFTYTAAVRELARIEVDLGRGTAAVRMVTEALTVVERLAARQIDKEMVEPHVLLARMYGALATVHLRMGHTAEAAAWRTKALALWNQLSTRPGFTSVNRSEMARFEASATP